MHVEGFETFRSPGLGWLDRIIPRRGARVGCRPIVIDRRTYATRVTVGPPTLGACGRWRACLSTQMSRRWGSPNSIRRPHFLSFSAELAMAMDTRDAPRALQPTPKNSIRLSSPSAPTSELVRAQQPTARG